MPTFTKSQQKIIKKIKHFNGNGDKPYDFWFIYDGDEAIDWEGGTELYNPAEPKPTDKFSVSGNNKFRNKYRLYKNKVTQNWE
jgi:hypothetical protein